MGCVREHIHGADTADAVADAAFFLDLEEAVEVAGQCGRIAGDVHDPGRSEMQKFAQELLVTAFARRVDDDGIGHHGAEIVVLSLTAEELGVLEVIGGSIGTGVNDGGLDRLDAHQVVADTRAEDADAAGAAVQIHQKTRECAVVAEIFFDFVIQVDRLLAVHLEKSIRRDAEDAVFQELVDIGLAPDIRPDIGKALLGTFFRLLGPDARDMHADLRFGHRLFAGLHEILRVQLDGTGADQDDHHLLAENADAHDEVAQVFGDVGAGMVAEIDLRDATDDLSRGVNEVALRVLHDLVALFLIQTDIHALLGVAVFDRVLHIISVKELVRGAEDAFADRCEVGKRNVPDTV